HVAADLRHGVDTADIAPCGTAAEPLGGQSSSRDANRQLSPWARLLRLQAFEYSRSRVPMVRLPALGECLIEPMALPAAGHQSAAQANRRKCTFHTSSPSSPPFSFTASFRAFFSDSL